MFHKDRLCTLFEVDEVDGNFFLVIKTVLDDVPQREYLLNARTTIPEDALIFTKDCIYGVLDPI